MPQEERLTPAGKHRFDPKRTRATFDVRYPGLEETYEQKPDLPHHQDVVSKRLIFNVQRQNIETVHFLECNFHSGHGLTVSSISYLTFSDCQFERSFMGAT